MLRHADVWRAIDRLAGKHGMSPSGLARAAGLDATTFNKSKRKSPEGKLRWPNTDSLARILEATGESLNGFVSLIGPSGGNADKRTLPMLAYNEAGRAGLFDETGLPTGRGWDEFELPAVSETGAYALKIGGSGLEPTYRAGNLLIVSPAAPIRRGDRVVIKSRKGDVAVRELVRRTGKRIELRSLNAAREDRAYAPDELRWMARIIWVSQ
jgi:phage repressor protein C with HTH and peptisase S24 domain